MHFISGESKSFKGDANIFQPDLCINNKWFEITLASDRDNTLNYIKSIRNGTFATDILEDVSIKCIKDACAKKHAKNYSIEELNVFIILTIPVYLWTFSAYSSLPFVPKTKFDNLLMELKELYCLKDKIHDIYIAMPGFGYDWIIYSSLKCGICEHVYLTNDEIDSKKVPFVIKQ